MLMAKSAVADEASIAVAIPRRDVLDPGPPLPPQFKRNGCEVSSPTLWAWRTAPGAACGGRCNGGRWDSKPKTRRASSLSGPFYHSRQSWPNFSPRCVDFQRDRIRGADTLFELLHRVGSAPESR